MLEGKCEENKVPKRHWTHPVGKNRSEQEQNKDNEKGTKRHGELKKMKRMRDEWKDNEKWSFMKWFLGQITLKYNLGLFILSFGTINLDLRYIPEKSILIECGYLDWRGFFP